MLEISTGSPTLPSTSDPPMAPKGAAPRPPRMALWAMDAWVNDAAVLTDRERLRSIMYEGVRAGGATVLGEKFCEFGNRAVTGVLVLAQSHLSIHTWPELFVANIDLLSCGPVKGEIVLDVIRDLLRAERTNRTCVVRALQ